MTASLGSSDGIRFSGHVRASLILCRRRCEEIRQEICWKNMTDFVRRDLFLGNFIGRERHLSVEVYSFGPNKAKMFFFKYRIFLTMGLFKRFYLWYNEPKAEFYRLGKVSGLSGWPIFTYGIPKSRSGGEYPAN